MIECNACNAEENEPCNPGCVGLAAAKDEFSHAPCCSEDVDGPGLAATKDANCSCAHNRDGSTTTLLCSRHAASDPCQTMASVTGKRRRGTIKGGSCTNCGWTSGNVA